MPRAIRELDNTTYRGDLIRVTEDNARTRQESRASQHSPSASPAHSLSSKTRDRGESSPSTLRDSEREEGGDEATERRTDPSRTPSPRGSDREGSQEREDGGLERELDTLRSPVTEAL
jgi:hypothetical protein